MNHAKRMSGQRTKRANGRKQTESVSDPLVDSWCHTFKHKPGYPENKILERQGHIIGKVGERYLVQWFEWMVGEPSNRELIHPDNMRDWFFYADGEEMRHSAEYGSARRHRYSDENERAHKLAAEVSSVET